MPKHARSNDYPHASAKKSRTSTKTYPRSYTKKSSKPAATAANYRTGGFIGKELKYYDTSTEAVTIPAAASLAVGMVDPATNALNTVPSGPGPEQRIGRNISMKKLTIRGKIIVPEANSGNADPGCNVMVAVVLDTQCNGASPTGDDIFLNHNNIDGNQTNCMRNLEYTTRFKVLKQMRIIADQQWVTGTQPDHANSGRHIPFQCDINLGSLRCQYTKPTTGGDEQIAAITDNALHVFAITDDSAGNTKPQIQYMSRLRYTG
jgi:hypothetical protein